MIPALFLTAVALLYADGLPFPLVNSAGTEDLQPLNETDQRAFLIYDDSEGLQRVVLDVKTEEYEGDFVWFIPIPHVPLDGEVFLEDSITEVDAAGFDLLSEWTEPRFLLEVREILWYSSPSIFSCSPASGGQDSRLQDSTSLDDSRASDWASRSTGSYQVSVYTGSSFDDFVAHVATEIGTDTSSALERARGSLIGYFDDSLSTDDGAPGPFAMLVLEGSRNTPSTSSPAVQIDTPTEAPFFALTVSRAAFVQTMDVSVYTAGEVPLEPAGAITPFEGHVILNGWPVSSEFAPGGIHLGREQENVDFYFADEVVTWGRYFDLDFIVSDSFESHYSAWMSYFRSRVSSAGYALEGRTTKESDEIPYLDGILGSSDEVTVSRFFRRYEDAEDLHDLVFEEAQRADWVGATDDYRGIVRLYAYYQIVVSNNTADLSFLLPLVFPAWLLARRRRRSKGAMADERVLPGR